MRVLQVGGRYLARYEQRLWIDVAGIVLCPLAAAAVGDGQSALALGVVAVAVSPRTIRRLRNVRHGRLGERVVTSALRRLPDDYVLVNDVVLDVRRGNIDHVLLGPCGVVVIETKRLAGHIRCHGDTWWTKGYRRGSISGQANAGAAAVRAFLSQRHPELVHTSLKHVESVVVFTHPLCRLEVRHARTIVVRFSELLTAVLALSQRQCLSSTDAERLARTLLSAGERRPR